MDGCSRPKADHSAPLEVLISGSSHITGDAIDAGMILPRLGFPAYVLAVRDLDGTTDYFVQALGFKKEWSEGSDWQGLVRGDVRLRLGHCPDSIPAENLGDHRYFGYIQTEDVDALYEEFSKAGAIIRSVPDSKPWGWREMAVATPEGHRMMFAQTI